MYLKGGNYQTIKENQTEKYVISLDTSFDSDYIDISGTNTISFRIYSAGADGSGTLTLKYSNDLENWETVTDNSSNDIEWTIDGADTDGADIQLPAVGYYRLSYAKGTNTEGTLIITVVR